LVKRGFLSEQLDLTSEYLASISPTEAVENAMPSTNQSDPTPEHPASALAVHSTGHLRRLRTQLTSSIPGDATFTAAVGDLGRMLIDHALGDPKRIEADKAAAATAKEASDKAAADALAQKQAQEKAALTPVDAAAAAKEAQAKAQADLDKKHADETAALASQKALADLDLKQADERKAFEAKQAADRAALAPKATEKSADGLYPLPGHSPSPTGAPPHTASVLPPSDYPPGRP
jgi:hypothetical protein